MEREESGSSDEGPSAEEQGLAGASVSRLHTLLQTYFRRLHDAVYVLPRQASQGASFGGYARDLLESSALFESIVRQLPDEVACHDSKKEREELQALLDIEVELDEKVERCAELAETLRQAAGRGFRDACAELCGGAVACVSPVGVTDTAATADMNATPQPAKSAWRPRPQLKDLRGSKSRRFAEELEFLQCLANPEYVHWLATQGYLNDPTFLRFLEYLQYWKNPPYVLYVVYPQSLRMLGMILDPLVRPCLRRLDVTAVLTSQLMWTWALSEEERLEGESTRHVAQEEVGVPASAKDRCVSTIPGGVVVGVPAVAASAPPPAGPELAAWRRRLAGTPTEVSVQEEAEQVGKRYLMASMPREKAEEVCRKFRRVWNDSGTRCDLASAASATSELEPLDASQLRVPTAAVRHLAPRAPAPTPAHAPAPTAAMPAPAPAPTQAEAPLRPASLGTIALRRRRSA